MWKHLLPIIKHLFSRNNYIGPIWIFIFDTDQAKLTVMVSLYNGDTLGEGLRGRGEGTGGVRRSDNCRGGRGEGT